MNVKTVKMTEWETVKRRLDRLEHKTRKKEIPDKLAERLRRHSVAIKELERRIAALEP